MNIHGIEGFSRDALSAEVDGGGKFVMYEYCISALVVTLRLKSDIHFVRPGDGDTGRRLGYSALSFFFGWWGFPWGPIYTIGTIATNLGGGRGVTAEAARFLRLKSNYALGGIDSAGIARLLRRDRPEGEPEDRTKS